MMFVAGPQGLKVGDSFRRHMEPVPEAATWPRDVREDNLRVGYLLEVSDETASKASGAKAKETKPTKR